MESLDKLAEMIKGFCIEGDTLTSEILDKIETKKLGLVKKHGFVLGQSALGQAHLVSPEPFDTAKQDISNKWGQSKALLLDLVKYLDTTKMKDIP